MSVGSPAPRDENFVTVMVGVDPTSSRSNPTIVPVGVDPVTNRVLVSSSGGSSNALATYALVQDDDTSSASYEYYGYVDADQNWVIKRVTISSNYSEFVTGTSGYATAWTNRATQTYVDYWSAF